MRSRSHNLALAVVLSVPVAGLLPTFAAEQSSEFGVLPAYAEKQLPVIDVGTAVRQLNAEGWPPYIELPLDVVEPSRHVPAAEWKSPYCAHWDDGCTECTRTGPNFRVECHYLIEDRDRECKKRTVVCFDTINIANFDQMCYRFLSGSLVADENGGMVGQGVQLVNEWYLDNGKWKHGDGLYPDDLVRERTGLLPIPHKFDLDGNVIAPFKWSNGNVYKPARGVIICLKTYSFYSHKKMP